MTITDAAFNSIAHQALRSTDGLETGGILLGSDQTDALSIRHAGGPGPNATRSELTFHRDLDHARRLADSAWLKDRSQWIGEWHTHPTGGLYPSEVDLRSYLRHLHDSDLGFDRFVAIIAGFDSIARVVVAAWLIERDRIEAVRLEKLSAVALGENKQTGAAVGQIASTAQDLRNSP